jgi:hypothetical protein
MIRILDWAERLLVEATAIALMRHEKVAKERDYWKKLAGRHAKTIEELKVTIELMEAKP